MSKIHVRVFLLLFVYLFYFVITVDGSPLKFDESTATPWTYKAE